MEPEYTPFDVVETYAYKLAAHWGVSLNSVVVRDQLSFRPQFLNAVDFVKARLWSKPLALIGRELTSLARRKLSDIVLSAAVTALIEFLRQDDPDIMEAVSYSGTIARDVEDMIAAINAYPPSGGRMKFDSIKSTYKLHQLTLQTEMKTIKEIVARIFATQERYRQAIEGDIMRSSDLAVISESIRLTMKGDFVPDDVASMFDKMEATREIRHIVCASPSGIHQKIYVPKPLENVPTAKVINMAAQMPSASITFTVSAISSSYQMTYYVEEGYIEGVNIRSADKDTVVTLCSAFLGLSLSTETWQIRCQARLYPTKPRPFKLMMHYLLHMTVVDPDVYQLRLDESTKAYPIKTEYIMRYRPAWHPSGIGFSKSIAKQESMSTFSCPHLLTGNNYISIDIESFTLASVFRTLASLIPTMCLYYSEHLLNASRLWELYNIPGISPATPLPSALLGVDVARQLHDEWPQVFTTAYLASVKGVKNLVRTTTNHLEAEGWELDVVTRDSREEKRGVGAFPSQAEPMFWYTSISPDAPFVGLAINTEDTNPLYPYVPASFVSASGSRATGGSGKETGVSLKALRVHGKEGDAPESLDIILGMKVKRSYTPAGPNSFVHAVMMAVMTGQDEEGTPVNPESLLKAGAGITEVRSSMSRLRMEVYKQQFYDVPLEEIARKLLDPKQYMDPLLYGAGLEHLFDVDIYVIKPVTDKNVSTHWLEMPRYREFYCRSSRARQCVILYNNPGIKSDMLLHPHCEIVKHDRTGVALFSPGVSKRMLSIMESSNNFMHSLYGGNLYLSNCMRSSLYLVLGSSGGTPVSQVIDSCGKARVVTVRVPATNQSERFSVSLFCFPAAPLNVRTSTLIYPCNAEWFERFCDAPPIGRSNIGLWGSHRASGEVLYVRTTKAPNLSIPFINQDPLMSEQGQSDPVRGSFVSASAARDRMAVVIREHLKWYFEIYSLYHGKIDVSAFVEECLGFVSPEQHEDLYYTQIQLVTDVLPRVNSVADVLEHIEAFVPQIEENKVLLHSEKYYRCMVYTLGKHSNTFSLRASLADRRHIKGFYTSLYDFKKHSNTLLIAGRSPVAQHTEGKTIGHNNRVITELRSTLLGSVDPLIYDSAGGVKYLVQATQVANAGAAYTVCEAWHVKGKNPGYFSLTSTEMPIATVVYLLEDNELKPSAYLLEGESVDALRDGEPFYEMIFSEKKYFALMRLL